MLKKKDFIDKFLLIQEKIYAASSIFENELEIGMSEHSIAELVEKSLRKFNLTEYWYPTLVYIGECTGKPVSRRIHLPSDVIILKPNDIICIDVTPLDDTVWGNWCKTYAIGENQFYNELCIDCNVIVKDLYNLAKSNECTIGNIIDLFNDLLMGKGYSSLGPYGSLGHTIFQVPSWSKVESFNAEERIMITEKYRNYLLKDLDIISIEPQIGKIDPRDGIVYGAKQDFILINK